MSWLVPVNEGKAVKTQLEKQGFKPVIKKLESTLHVATDGPQTLLQYPQCQNCDLCKDSQPSSRPNKRFRYTVYPPLILFSSGSDVSVEDAASLLKANNCSHAAINTPIPDDDIVRRPRITPLIGDFGPFFDTFSQENAQRSFWCTSKQNEIYQTWAPLYTMFSRGNITEKKRALDTFASQTKIEGSVLVDLYCGIGYFTFSYARNNPKVVYGWELNPWSVEGLVRGARENKWNVRVIHHNEEYTPQESDKLVIFNEDNAHALERLSRIPDKISHINMGLLPDCRAAWDTAKKLKSSETVVHVHENVHENDMQRWEDEVALEMGKCLHVERIKQFSPGVWHVCGDFRSV